MSRIRILPESVANKIAAGEVVERPASVVKELLENALDAGAKAVRVEVEQGGKRMIRVIDDGQGMTHDDALLAFERHATSKLRTADDLLSIATLGFRGEALQTIAAVSLLLLETRDAAEPEGTRIEFAGGKLVSVKPAGLPAGTTISVADLFYSVPARRKFLKADTTELGHIASLVTHYALANPDKQFVLSTPTQTIIDCPPSEKLADRVYQLFGRQALDELVEIPPIAAPFRSAITEQALDPVTPAPLGVGVPRAVIPAMEEIDLGSGVGSDGAFDLSSRPVQPVEERFRFEPGSSLSGGAPSTQLPVPAAPNWVGNLAGAN